MKTVPILAVLAALAAPVAAFGQTTIFSDGFVNSSTLNPTASTLVTPTANRTSYEIACAKNATGSGISSGTFTLSTAATSSGFNEAQALFTTAPITLTSAGQYIELFYTFKCTANVLNGTAGNSSGLYIGLYNSGGSAPTNGTFLWNGGMSSSSNNATTGGCQNWLGYAGDFLFSSNTLATSVISTRPAQTLANNFAQELLYATVYTGGSGFSGSHAGTLAEPSLTVGNYYTMALQITYVSSTSLAITNTIYGGAGIGGSVVSVGGYTTTYGGVSTSAQDITSTFDGLAIGYRAGATAATTLPITNITVIDYIPSLPAITGLTNETVVAGTSPTLSPSVTGVPTPSYQWQTNGVNIGGATSASLPLPSVQYAQNGYVYSLIASNLVGAVTNSMTLSVIVPPSITGLGNQAAATGDTVVLSPTIGGQPAPTLQWQTNGVNVTDGVDGNGSTISGSTTGTLTITGAQTGDSGTYSLIASNSAGIITNSMTLTVSGGNVLPSITGPLNQTNTQGANVTFSATVSGLPLPTVQWLDQTQTPITGATNLSLTLTNIQFSQNGYSYYVVANNIVGSVTNSATLTVLVPAGIVTQPVSLVVTNTQAAAFTVVASGQPAPTYQWYKGSSQIPNATNATYSITSVVPTNAGSYYVSIVNSSGTTNSATVTLTVNSVMAVAALSPANSATGICYDTPLYLTFSSTPVLQTAGTIKIYNVTNSATPVDTINLALNVTPNANAKNVQPRTIATETFTNYPVIITGNQAAIYTHSGVLTSNQTYYVIVDNGTFADAAGANFAGITATNAWQFTTKVAGPANPTSILVSADGTGDFVTVQGAIDSVTSGNTTPTLITINNGRYYEIVDIKSKHNLTLRGQSRNGTVVGYANNANLQGSTHFRMAMKVNANDIALDNLTLTNFTVAGGSQAEALMLESNAKRFIFNNANLGSFQDTLLANGGGQAQAYFNNSLITGQFDYVWGGGDIFFTNCEFLTVYGSGSSWNLTASRTDNTAIGTWPGYNGLASSNGFSFVDCYLAKVTGAGVGNPTLADSNGTTNGVSAWINCRIQKDYVAPSAGVINSQLLWEYNNTNNDTGLPVTYGLSVLTSSDPRLLAAENASTWLYGWQPQLTPNILTNPVGSTVTTGTPVSLSVIATGIPDPTYQWYNGATLVSGATSATLTLANPQVSDSGSYTVVVTTTAGSVTSSAATLTVNAPPNTAPVFTSPASGTNIVINAGVNLSVPVTATDSDSPAQTLTYSLLAGPGSASVNPSTGTLTWRPTVAQAKSTNAVQVVVTDNGTPSMSATNSFTVVVNPVIAASLGTATYSGSQFSLTVSGGTAGPDYILQGSTNLFDWVNIVTNSSPTLPFTLQDTNTSPFPARFYRVKLSP